MKTLLVGCILINVLLAAAFWLEQNPPRDLRGIFCFPLLVSGIVSVVVLRALVEALAGESKVAKAIALVAFLLWCFVVWCSLSIDFAKVLKFAGVGAILVGLLGQIEVLTHEVVEKKTHKHLAYLSSREPFVVRLLAPLFGAFLGAWFASWYVIFR